MEDRAESIDRTMHPLFQAGEGGSKPTSALDLKIEFVQPKIAASLNKAWHSKLPEIDLPTCKGHAAFFGAVYNGIIYAVAIWSDPVAPSQDDGQTIELRRFAISPDAPKNTASRMLKIMRMLILKKWGGQLYRAISYQAVGIHEGTIYKAAGWMAENYSTYAEWGTRKRRKRAAGFRVAPSTRKPSQIKCDKVRWAISLSIRDASSEARRSSRQSGHIRKQGIEETHEQLFGTPKKKESNEHN